jgi:hypothetical protein
MLRSGGGEQYYRYGAANTGHSIDRGTGGGLSHVRRLVQVQSLSLFLPRRLWQSGQTGSGPLVSTRL